MHHEQPHHRKEDEDPERNTARTRSTDISYNAPKKRLSMDVDDDMASVDDNVGVDMMFDDDNIPGGSSPSGAGGVIEDTMMECSRS